MSENHSERTRGIEGAEEKRVRLTIELTRRLDTTLEKIASSTGASKAEVLRFAIDFLDAGVTAKKDGMMVGGWLNDAKGERTKEREFIGL